MDVKLNINLNSNLMNLGKSGSAATGAANLNAGALNLKNANLQSGDKSDILSGAANSLSSPNEGESSADILKKQLEKQPTIARGNRHRHRLGAAAKPVAWGSPTHHL